MLCVVCELLVLVVVGCVFRRTAQNFALFLDVFSLNFGGVFEGRTLKCARLGYRAVV